MGGENQPSAMALIPIDQALGGTGIARVLLQKIGGQMVQVGPRHIAHLAAAPTANEMPGRAMFVGRTGTRDRVGEGFEDCRWHECLQSPLVSQNGFLKTARRGFPGMAVMKRVATQFVSLRGR